MFSMAVSLAVSRFSSVLADRMEAMLRFGTEQEQGDPGDPSESPSLPDVENAVPDDVQDSALQNIESLGPIFGAILNMVIGVVSGIVLTDIVALAVGIELRTRSRMLSHMNIMLVSVFNVLWFLCVRCCFVVTVR